MSSVRMDKAGLVRSATDPRKAVRFEGEGAGSLATLTFGAALVYETP